MSDLEAGAAGKYLPGSLYKYLHFITDIKCIGRLRFALNPLAQKEHLHCVPFIQSMAAQPECVPCGLGVIGVDRDSKLHTG